MKIAVLADSASYLSPEQVEKYNANVVPIPVIWGDKTYKDLVDITFDEFYARLKTDSVLPTTSTPSLGEFNEVLDKLKDEGYTDVIAVTISSGLSSFYNNLSQVANERDDIHVHPFDSKVTCAGSGAMAMLAGKLVQENKSIDEIIKALEEVRATTYVRFMVDDLSHLKRTGRLSNASSFIGGLLKIKPILTMDVQDKGLISAIAKERQAKKAYEHIKHDFAEQIKDVDYPVMVTVFDGHNEKVKHEWMDDLQASFPNVRVASSIIGPVVGVHVGQDCMAIIWSRDIESF